MARENKRDLINSPVMKRRQIHILQSPSARPSYPCHAIPRVAGGRQCCPRINCSPTQRHDLLLARRSSRSCEDWKCIKARRFAPVTYLNEVPISVQDFEKELAELISGDDVISEAFLSTIVLPTGAAWRIKAVFRIYWHQRLYLLVEQGIVFRAVFFTSFRQLNSSL